MPSSLSDPSIAAAIKAARQTSAVTVQVDGKPVSFSSPFHSPEDWRDQWIYFLLVDRFNNPNGPPAHGAYDSPEVRLQGGTLEGIRQKLGYLKDLGTGAIWISPVLKNWPWNDNYWGGYATQDFLTIEPRFTSNPAAARANPALGDQEFRRLVDEAHARKMYVILDIVLNHASDVFNYEGQRDSAPWSNSPYQVYWRDKTGTPQGNWTDIGAVAKTTALDPDAAIWPAEFQRNDFFRRQGADGPDNEGDFDRMKELATYLQSGSSFPVRDALINAYRYLIAKFDIDGFRIDTLMYIERDFARTFGNAMREFALSIGKKNFFTFGEVWEDDDESEIDQFIGSDTADVDMQVIGVDAAIDFPIRKRIVQACLNQISPKELSDHFDYRKSLEKSDGLLSSHGEASRYFVTFLDNHDLPTRMFYSDPADPRKYEPQFTLALTCLFCLQGIPTIYYGNEQGLSGHGSARESARECLWGKPSPFDPANSLYLTIQMLAQQRAASPALRYGRQYFRPVSGTGATFGLSDTNPGIIAVSRILNDEEVVMVGTTDTTKGWSGYVLIDSDLHADGAPVTQVFSNLKQPGPTTTTTQAGNRVIYLSLRPMEAKILTFS